MERIVRNILLGLLIAVVGIPTAWADSTETQHEYVPIIRSDRFWEYWYEDDCYDQESNCWYGAAVARLFTFKDIYIDNDTVCGTFTEIENHAYGIDLYDGERYDLPSKYITWPYTYIPTKIKDYHGKIYVESMNEWWIDPSMSSYDFNSKEGEQMQEQGGWVVGSVDEIEIDGEMARVYAMDNSLAVPGKPLWYCFIEGIGPGGGNMAGTVWGEEPQLIGLPPSNNHILNRCYSSNGNVIYQAPVHEFWPEEVTEWSLWKKQDGVSRTETANGLDLKLIDRKLTGQAGTSGMCTLTVNNQSGATVAKLIGKTSISYDTQQLAPGVYIAVLDDGKGGVKRLKFVR